jgi:uncharacterized protein (TIGR03083 family)
MEQLEALRNSVTRLRAIVEGFDADQLRARAYPAEWSVADVLSHIGSSGVILQTRLDAALAGRELAEGFEPPIWDEWNAKSPDAKAADALVADRAFLEAVDALDESQRATVRVTIGPLNPDLAALVGLRLNEHALHTWDVEVVVDPNATVPVDAASVVIDNLDLIVRFAGRPTGEEHDVNVHTTNPARDFTLTLGSDALSLSPARDLVPNRPLPDLELSADAFIRLVYGRFDPAHASTVRGDASLDELRRAFPGV